MLRVVSRTALRRAALSPSIGFALTVLSSPNAVAACTAGAQACPIPIRMERGSDTATLKGRFRKNADCCAYTLDARAGQTLTWGFEGPSERATIAYPNGEVDGPGVPTSIPLDQTGTYVFRVSPNLMADGSFGPFRLTITIR